MLDLMSRLGNLRRPPLLAAAARAGQPHYRRARHLPRMIGRPAPQRHAQVLIMLLEREAELEAQRKTGAAHYSAARHVEVLIAIRAEAALMQAAPPTLCDQVKASGTAAFLPATYAAKASAMAGSRGGC